jgi:hypothetical protein
VTAREKGVRLVQKMQAREQLFRCQQQFISMSNVAILLMQVGPRVPVGMQRYKAGVGPTSGLTGRPAHRRAQPGHQRLLPSAGSPKLAAFALHARDKCVV